MRCGSERGVSSGQLFIFPENWKAGQNLLTVFEGLLCPEEQKKYNFERL